MRSTTVLGSVALLLAGNVVAQNSTNSTVIRVEVGNGGLVFNPASVTAAPGTKIEFDFYPQNHSVVQSDFNSPCQPRVDAIYSGFIPSRAGVANTSFVLTVNDTNPIWYYCSQARHCQSGMVGVINPPNGTNQTLPLYAAAAARASQNNSPTGGVAGGSAAPNGSAVASASSASSAASASATASSTSGGSGGSGGSTTGTATGAGASSTTAAANAVTAAGSGGILTGLVMGVLAMLL